VAARAAPVACGDVDGLRSGYTDDQEGRWFPGDRGYGERYEEERYRVPEPRHAGPEYAPPEYADPLDTRNPIGPRSGVELPPLPAYGDEQPYPESVATEPTGEHHTQPIDRAALRRPTESIATPGRASEPVPTPAPSQTLYKTRRAGVAGLVAVPAVVAELFLVRVLLAGEFGPTVLAGAVLGALLAMTGIPLVAIGMYSLITGPSATAGPNVVRSWLRTPLAYLPIGLILLIAAGLATR
jgi:hypothetical protein